MTRISAVFLRSVASAAIIASLGRIGAPAGAQVVEHHLPPVLAPPPAMLATPKLPPAEEDDRPIGPPLAAIVALGATDAVRGSGQGIDLHAVPRLDNAEGATTLRPFLGKPLSRKLIAGIEVAVTRFYRRAGFPFVSVSTPEQDIDAGVLRIRIVEFRAGTVQAHGGRAGQGSHVERAVRLKSGDPIDADRLSEDLDWLNRNPFRQVGAQFSPGTGLGESDIDLSVVSVRPWRVYGGATSSGSAATGRLRYFVGAMAAGLPGVPDALLSVQITGSPDAVRRVHPQYLSEAVRLSLPFAARQSIEISYDHVTTAQTVEAFDSRQTIDEASLGYRIAASELLPFFSPRIAIDLIAGIEARRAQRHLYFGDVDVSRASIDVVQFYAGYTARASDPHGSTSFSATFHASPGGIGVDSDAAALASFAQRPGATAGYVYANGEISRFTTLPKGFSLQMDLSFQYAGIALPQTERIGIGGPSAVRGYMLDDGGFDSAAILRTTLQVPPFALLRKMAGAGVLQPHLFLDFGVGRDAFLRQSTTALSTGAGADYRMGSHVQGGADMACALHDATYTRRGDCRVEARLTLLY